MSATKAQLLEQNRLLRAELASRSYYIRTQRVVIDRLVRRLAQTARRESRSWWRP